MTFIDEATNYVRVKIIREKGHASIELERHVIWIERQTGRRVVRVFVDGGGEYLKAAKALIDDGMEIHVTAPYTLEENGRAGRINHTLMNSVRSMIAHSGARGNFCAECLLTAADVRNVVAKRGDTLTPTEKLQGYNPPWSTY